MTNREFYNAIVNGTIGEAEVEFAKAAIQKLNVPVKSVQSQGK